jgi:hypothetical protein
MKKVLPIMVVIAFVACNGSSTTAEKAVDSSAAATIDSLKTVNANSVNEADTATNGTVDSIKAGAGSAKRKL